MDTPIRLPVLLPESNIIPFASGDWFLHPSPELCMKRLLARGCPQIFQICHCFRREESGRHHQPEFTLLEWYHQGWEYGDLMEECEELVRAVCQAASGYRGVSSRGTLLYKGAEVVLDPPWERLTVEDAFRRHATVSLREALTQDRFDEILVTQIEQHLGKERPVFLCDYPVELGSLARCSASNPQVAERFELYIGGLELANGFSELTDPQEQRARFFRESRAIVAGGQKAAMPEIFLADLSFLGETAGIALGVDRLFMLAMGCENIAEVMSFGADDL